MKMKGHDLCMVWSLVPGLSAYWAQQLQWRIGMDEEVIAALSEPRYPSPEGDQSLDVIVLTQTVYLCQLFLHLQEFDPCTTGDDDDESLRIFQDALAREFNAIGPAAPDGLVLERVVRGLMMAQRENPSSPPTPSPTKQESDQHQQQQTSPRVKIQLQQLLVAVLDTLNQPLHKQPVRYEAQYGPRTAETWAARFATRVMQWRALVREPRRVVEGVVEVQREDVAPLDEGGLEVYRLVRDGAPGNIHIATPLQPPMIQQQQRRRIEATQPPPPHHQRVQQYHHQQEQPTTSPQQHQQQHSISSGVTQHGLPSPIGKKSHSPASETCSKTPHTMPHGGAAAAGAATEAAAAAAAADAAAAAAVKRSSQDLGGLPPSKRPRSMQALQSTSREALAAAGYETADSQIPIRGGGSTSAAVGDVGQGGREVDDETTNVLLRRVLDGIGQLGQKMDDMRGQVGVRFDRLDHRIQQISDWIGIEEDDG